MTTAKGFINVSDDGVFDIAVLSEQFDVPLYRMKEAVKSGALKGRKVGRVYLVTGKAFKEWVGETGLS